MKAEQGFNPDAKDFTHWLHFGWRALPVLRAKPSNFNNFPCSSCRCSRGGRPCR